MTLNKFEFPPYNLTSNPEVECAIVGDMGTRRTWPRNDASIISRPYYVTVCIQLDPTGEEADRVYHCWMRLDTTLVTCLSNFEERFGVQFRFYYHITTYDNATPSVDEINLFTSYDNNSNSPWFHKLRKAVRAPTHNTQQNVTALCAEQRRWAVMPNVMSAGVWVGIAQTPNNYINQRWHDEFQVSTVVEYLFLNRVYSHSDSSSSDEEEISNVEEEEEGGVQSVEDEQSVEEEESDEEGDEDEEVIEDNSSVRSFTSEEEF